MLERQAAPLTTKIVCVADAMRDQSLAAGIGTRSQYVTVYSGMETGSFINPQTPRDAVRERLGIVPGDVVAGTISRLFHLKGHDDLLEAAPDLCPRFPDLRFLWVGDGLLRSRFESRIAELGLRDRFILTGLVPPEQIPELASAMDMLVHPSRREGLARAIVQGQLAGAPAIAYDIDGNREGMIDGQTGILIPPFDQKRLADAIVTLVDDNERRRAMGRVGREFALGRFDADVMVDGLEHVYAEAVAAVT
jgi:glycosyltransferase involved in cell wall biosynthesis